MAFFLQDVRVKWLMVFAALAVASCGDATTPSASSAAGQNGPTLMAPATGSGSALPVETKRAVWATVLDTAWVARLAPKTATRIKFEPIGDGVAVTGTMVILFFPQPIIIPAGTPELTAASEEDSAKGNRSIAPIAEDQMAPAVMVAVVGGIAIYAGPVPEPIATHELDGSEAIEALQ